MHSIRRSLLGYLLLLVALALGAVGLLVDRFAKQVITAREVAEKSRIDAAFEVRRKEAVKKFDSDILAEAKSMAVKIQLKIEALFGLSADRPPPNQPPSPAQPPTGTPGGGPGRSTDPLLRASDSELEQYRVSALVMHMAAGPARWHTAAIGQLIDPTPIQVPEMQISRGGQQQTTGEPPKLIELPRLSPIWSAYDTQRVIPRLKAELLHVLDDEDHPGGFQVDLVDSSTRQSHALGSVPSTRLGHDLPSVDPATIGRPGSQEYVYDDVDVPGVGKYRRTLKVGGRTWVGFRIWLSPPAAYATNSAVSIPGMGMVRFAGRPPNLVLRVYIHHVRPYSELLDRLAKEDSDQEEQIQAVREETREALTDLRTKLWLIGAGSFLALVIGGWVIVARGLAPIGALSVAVSQVSEKDFRLALPAAKLSRELAPIHACLTQTLDLLRLAFAREKQAVADISHELRTPIAGLLATIDVSLRKPRSPEQYRATLEDCRAISHQLSQLVERIMTLASLDAGTARTAVGRVDAVELAGICGSIIRGLAEAHNLAFTIRADEPIELDTDPDQLREVLMNLLHNAIEYNRPGGEVELAVYRVGQEAVFEVRDTGIGMPPEVRERIFERFFRADPSRHATGVHAGLGLAIVKEYVDRLGGTISVDSQPDVGTTFRVTLPGLSSEPAPSTEGPRSGPWARGEVAPTGS